MPRVKQFDIDEALDRAKDLFWERGYEATSMADLLEAMGINRGSFYDTFESKHAVMLEALRRYDDEHRRIDIDEVIAGKPAKDAIMAVFECLVDPSRARQGKRGCFLVNAALELAPHDPQVADIVKTSFKDMEKFFVKLIQMGQKEGQINKQLDPKEASRALTNHMLGLMVLVRSGASKTMFKSVLEQIEQMLG